MFDEGGATKPLHLRDTRKIGDGLVFSSYELRGSRPDPATQGRRDGSR